MSTIAILHSCPVLPSISTFGEHSREEIELTIATTNESGDQPRNASYQWSGPAFQPGGMSARLVSGYYGVSILSSGRDISHCNDPREYMAAAKALETVTKRQSAMLAKRGTPSDQAEQIGRWMEACGVTEVFFREWFKAVGWHSDGEWKRVTPGVAVDMIREATKTAEADYKARCQPHQAAA